MRRPQSYKRRGSQREPYDSVLIVCEGSKTEPQYLQGLKQAFKLSSANIRVVPADGTDPVSVVRHARALDGNPNEYDRVYCVIDRDGHANFNEAIGLMREFNYLPIVSWPCFEIWIMLHFSYSTAPYNAAGNRSACDNVLRDVQNVFQSYTKGLVGIYTAIEKRTDEAIERAIRLAKHNETTRTYNPSTAMHELVSYLRKLKE